MAKNENPLPEDLSSLLQDVVQRITTLHDQQQATQAVLIATIAALGKASSAGLRLIETHALKAGEVLAHHSPQASQVPYHIETLLGAARAAVTGQTPPRGR